MAKGGIYIGTSGWSYKHWKGIYYPKGLASSKWLNFYAAQFNISEINTSFYRLPTEETVTNWTKNTPDDFLFCPKMSRYLTQFKKLNEPLEPLERFFRVFQPMQQKLGPVLVQLPPSLAYHRDKTELFFKTLKAQYPQYKFAIEVRHQSWLESEPLLLMKKYHVAFVISQSNGHFPYAEHVTAKHVYVRFHGPGQLYASSYSDEQLVYYANFFLKWKQEGRKVYAFFNNDISGYAIVDAGRLKAMTENNN